MCKNHDRAHYSPWARNLASVVTLGQANERDLLLELATYEGLAAFVERTAAGMSSDRLSVCVRQLKVEGNRVLPLKDTLSESLYSTWGDELDRLLSLPPWVE